MLSQTAVIVAHFLIQPIRFIWATETGTRLPVEVPHARPAQPAVALGGNLPAHHIAGVSP